MKRFRLWIVLFWTNVKQRHHIIYIILSHYIILIHIVLENDNTC